MQTRTNVNGERPDTNRPSQDQLIALFEANVDDLYRHCLIRTGNEVVAEDATSEAFLAAARAHAAGRGASVDRPWLFVVARRRIIDHWRSNERHRRRIIRLAGDSTLADGGDPVGLAVDQLLGEQALAALQSLPERQRAALTLRYLDECSVAEVATALSVEYRAAESLLSRARRGFSKAWQSASQHPTSQQRDENA